ncbi:PulJ/GspJ family protein [Luteibacter sp. W1I16]|uniref:PulJ/GspJ family protein n=1 Tax=Luteibacter sp. W1I16 TaxID=3373922 RepID=UPI003D23FEB7
MVVRSVTARGMTLVELLVGLAVAAIVAAVAMTGLSIMGLAVVRQRAATRMEDAVWLAHAAIARDLCASARWKGCVEARGCTAQGVHGGMRALVLDHAEWFVDKGLWRCEGAECGTYLDGIAGAEFIALLQDGGSLRQVPFAPIHGNTAKALEVVLWTSDGHRYSRTTGRKGCARIH